MSIGELLRVMEEKCASDLYLKADTPPTYRIEGETCFIGEKLNEVELSELANSIMNEEQRRTFSQTHEMNLAYAIPGVGRYRCNLYYQRGSVGIVFRRVKLDIPSVEELNLPTVLNDLALEPRGLILVTGATGSGKSTTLAAMIDYRNTLKSGHIISIEDPIEFVHYDKKSIISQREVGIDTESFAEALKNTLRQAPDVILIGEMRDVESVSSAIYFAETGHLVMSTLHSTNANQTIERILQFYPSSVHEQILLQLSFNLRAIISQRLLPRKDGQGRIVAVEVMMATPRIKSLILKGEIGKIKDAIEAGTQEGMQTFDQSLHTLYQQELISLEDAMSYADSPNDLKMRIKGLRTSGG
ncbi:MAG: PilT/PilU family type 4a pilus ATPase [bacterium]|nr:PilT/PilU family type 4a pilus ATPase [bacterium]